MRHCGPEMSRNSRRAHEGFRTGDGGHRRQYPVPYVISRTRPSGRRGLADPAYIADTPHDLVLATQGLGTYRSTMSAAELEAEVLAAPAIAELLELDLNSRERYDGGGRLLAKHVLEHLGRHPEDVGLPDVLQRQVLQAHPELRPLDDSTARWAWAMAAAQRVFDAHQDG